MHFCSVHWPRGQLTKAEKGILSASDARDLSERILGRMRRLDGRAGGHTLLQNCEPPQNSSPSATSYPMILNPASRRPSRRSARALAAAILLGCSALSAQVAGDFLVAVRRIDNFGVRFTNVLRYQPTGTWTWSASTWLTGIFGHPLAMEQDSRHGSVYMLIDNAAFGTRIVTLGSPFQTGCLPPPTGQPTPVVVTSGAQPIRDIWLDHSPTGPSQVYFAGFDSTANCGFLGRTPQPGGTGIPLTPIPGMGDPVAITVVRQTGRVWVVTKIVGSHPAKLHSFTINASGTAFVAVAGYPKSVLGSTSKIHDLVAHSEPSVNDSLILSFSIGPLRALRRVDANGVMGHPHGTQAMATMTPVAVSVNDSTQNDLYVLFRDTAGATMIRYYNGGATPGFQTIPVSPPNGAAISWISRTHQSGFSTLNTTLGNALAIDAPYTNQDLGLPQNQLTFQLANGGVLALGLLLGTSQICGGGGGGPDILVTGTVLTFTTPSPLLTIPFPNLASLNGIDLHAQWFGLDSSNHLATSSCMSTRLGLARGN